MLARRDFTKGLLASVSAASIPAASAMAREGSDAALCYAPVVELIAAFKAGRLSPVDLLQAQIKRIEEYNPLINAITYKHFDEAMAEAKELEERYKKGTQRPLEGITVAFKDESERVGWRVTMGSLAYKDAPPAEENSAIIDALEAAGAVLHVQTTVPEFYLSASASTYAWGTTRNPWNLDYSPGGSSSGSGASLAAGFATLATGSDMGGSIRVPASQCGLYGFKAPFGRVATSEISYPKSRMRRMGRWPEGSTTWRACRTPSSGRRRKYSPRCGRNSIILCATIRYRRGALLSTGGPRSTIRLRA